MCPVRWLRVRGAHGFRCYTRRENDNMKMKNSKVMLALFVVAALAMVSVAGAAMASE